MDQDLVDKWIRIGFDGQSPLLIQILELMKGTPLTPNPMGPLKGEDPTKLKTLKVMEDFKKPHGPPLYTNRAGDKAYTTVLGKGYLSTVSCDAFL